MNPRALENRFLAELREHGFLAEKALFSIKTLPNNRMITKRADFFGVWDIIAFRDNLAFTIQICSGTTYDDHVRKINAEFPMTLNPAQIIVYYFKEKRMWKYTLHMRTEVGWIPVSSLQEMNSEAFSSLWAMTHPEPPIFPTKTTTF